MTKISFFFSFFLVFISCITTNKKHSQNKMIASYLEAEMILDMGSITINLINNTSDPIFVPPLIGTRGFDLIVTHQESKEIVHDTRGSDISIRKILLNPGEVYKIAKGRASTNKVASSVDMILFFDVHAKKPGYYDICFVVDKHNINECVTVYFDYERLYREL